MSVLNQEPFITKVLNSLTEIELTNLRKLVNGKGDEPIFRTLAVGSPLCLSIADKGIKNARIEVPDAVTQTIYQGYLIYNDDYCVLISYSSDASPILLILEMKLVDGKWKYQISTCDSSILEFRGGLRDSIDETTINAKITALSSIGLQRKVVSSLPTGSDIETNVIYLVLNTESSQEGNVYDEYMYISNAWELLGTTATSGGSGIEVVEISNSSGHFSDSDFAKVSGYNCVIKYSSQIFYKSEDTSETMLVYKQITSTGSSGIWVGEIIIMASTQDYNLTYYTINSTTANPTLSGGESALTSISIGGTSYSVGGGGSASLPFGVIQSVSYDTTIGDLMTALNIQNPGSFSSSDTFFYIVVGVAQFGPGFYTLTISNYGELSYDLKFEREGVQHTYRYSSASSSLMSSTSHETTGSGTQLYVHRFDMSSMSWPSGSYLYCVSSKATSFIDALDLESCFDYYYEIEGYQGSVTLVTSDNGVSSAFLWFAANSSISPDSPSVSLSNETITAL